MSAEGGRGSARGGAAARARDFALPEEDLRVSFVRSAGPGGQNVNKVATAAQLRFDLAGTRALSDPVKQRLRALAGRRVTEEGEILIVARSHRTQEGNRREALARLRALVEAALVEPRVRRATRPTRASRERRLVEKSRAQRVKRLRGKVRGEE